ncbi:MAG: nucleotidyltransferase family protein [Nitrospinae bacterium]|nr:nucleotidyltransferase family protein [Nitrospinota bacterium]
MEAIILAGGFGTRLKDVVKDVPKPMADVGGKPFLRHIFEWLLKSGVSRVILSVGYRSEVIVNYFGASFCGVEIAYSSEDEPLGTGGAVRRALALAKSGDVLVLNGDSFFDVDPKKLFAFHLEKKSMMTMALKPMLDFERYGSVEVEGGMIVGFREKALVKSGLINAGVYVVRKKLAELLEEYKTPFSLEADFLQKKCLELKVAAYVGNGYFIDIGVPEDYKRARAEFEKCFQGGVK